MALEHGGNVSLFDTPTVKPYLHRSGDLAACSGALQLTKGNQSAPPPANEPAGNETPPQLTLGDESQTPAPPNGVDEAIAMLRADYDPSAVVIWKTSGPRNSHVEAIAGVLCEIGDVRRILIVQAFDAGTFKLYLEIPGKAADAQSVNLANLLKLPMQQKTITVSTGDGD